LDQERLDQQRQDERYEQQERKLLEERHPARAAALAGRAVR
jgi:hypothetical protein